VTVVPRADASQQAALAAAIDSGRKSNRRDDWRLPRSTLPV
jgi:hypothetical protein